MGKKRRQTAKTGDRAVYRKQPVEVAGADSDDDDDMYDRVDRFHISRDKEFLNLNSTQDSESSDDDDELEAVMDLAAGGESGDSEDESSSDDENLGTPQKSTALDDDDDDNDSSSEGEEPMEDVRDWGHKKSAYYHGDTADMEIGQDEEDAYLEEEAAKEVEAARYEEMSEEDFVLSDGEDADKDKQGKTEEVGVNRDLSKLTKKEKRIHLDKNHPELLPILSHFTAVVNDLGQRTLVATNALFDGDDGTAESVGASKLGQQYLLAKCLLQSSATLNLAVYLLLKDEQSKTEGLDPAIIQSHPVMARLQKLNSLYKKLMDDVEGKVPHLNEQLTNLVKAAGLLRSGEVNEISDDSSASETSVVEDETVPAMDNLERADIEAKASAEESDDEVDGEEKRNRHVLTEARFGLRQNEIIEQKVQSKRKRRRAVLDYADEDGTDLKKGGTKTLATTLNSIEQRTASKQRRKAPMAEDVDEPMEEDGELRRGLEMMEAELGKMSDEDGHEEDSQESFDAEIDDEDGDGFYSQIAKKTKSKKDFKKNLYKVAPKFPRVEREVDGERAISRAILKNRGLVAHKPKINRNPRVKKREQYRKALIRRKGAVRTVRTDEGHKYGGEETGIKTGISRSRKLVS